MKQIVTRGRGSFFVVAAVAILGLFLHENSVDAQAIFRARTESVAISASVKRGNAPVANLTANDFKLTDNGVAQSIEAVTIESVPLDVTLFMDTSGSTAGSLDRMKSNVISIAKMLRPDDQFRLLTIGLSVDTPVPWQRAGSPIALDMKAVPGISLVYDALFVALDAHAGGGTAPSDRRDDRRRGLRQPPRWRARPRRERAIRSGAALDLRQQPGRFRSVQRSGVVHAERCARSRLRRAERRREPAATRIARASATPPSARSRRSSTSSVRATCFAIRRTA